jgi:Domain of unknown function (DUF1996)
MDANMKQTTLPTSLAIMTLSGIMLSFNAQALETPIYKWQDNRGITQYSDRAPTVPYTKATRFEMINALQAKELCTVPASASPLFTGKPVLATNTATPEYSANFFGGINNTAAQAARQAKVQAAKLSRAARAAAKRAAAAAKAAAKAAARAAAVAAKSAAAVAKSPGGGQPTAAAQAAAAQAAAAQAAAAQAAAAQAAAAQATAAQAAAAQAAAAQATAAQATAAQAAANTPNPNLIQVGLMPAVDISKNIKPAVGFSTLRIKDTTEMPTPNTNPYGGEFRLVCTVSHMSNDDPLVYPNQPGAAHHHMFFGNTTINAKSDLNNLPNVGNSTCNGGIMNRSGYWAPTIIDTTTHTPQVPDFTIFYYKSGGAPGAMIKAPPKGLKMIAGNSKGNSPTTSKAAYTCMPPGSLGPNVPFYGWHKNIPACPVGWSLDMSIFFNQCWDGVNLDSPDHQSHMAPGSNANNTPARIAAGTANRCPDTHPIAIPQITLNMRYKVLEGMDLSKWRLSSDNYDVNLPGGYSAHADWVNGWDEQVMDGIIKNCLNIQGDCHAHLLGAGKGFY